MSSFYLVEYWNLDTNTILDPFLVRMKRVGLSEEFHTLRGGEGMPHL